MSILDLFRKKGVEKKRGPYLPKGMKKQVIVAFRCSPEFKEKLTNHDPKYKSPGTFVRMVVEKYLEAERVLRERENAKVRVVNKS